MNSKSSQAVRVAIYVRVSTEEQKFKGLSIDAQKDALTAWAREHKMKIVDTYNDAGISARKVYAKRPELLRMLDDVKAGKIDLIIFTKLDRWFRNIAEYYKVQEILEASKVDWKTIHEDYDTSTASGRLKINIMLSVAQDEADRDSERIKAVFDAKRSSKEPVTGMVPTGYIIRDKKMIKDPELEAAVDLYFSTYLTLRSVTKAREAVREQTGVFLSHAMADSMLRKPAYYGEFNDVPGMCPSYITPQQHQDIVDNRRKRQPRRPGGDRVYLFTGLIFCPECGHRFAARSHRWPRKGNEWSERTSYNCPGRYTHNICSNNVNIRERDIEKFLLENIDCALYDFKMQAQSITAVPPAVNPAQKAKLKKKLERLKDLYINDMIDMDMYKRDYAELTAELDALEVKEKAASAAPDFKRIDNIFPAGWQSIYAQLSMSARQDFWRMAMDKIYIHPDRHITFTFQL